MESNWLDNFKSFYETVIDFIMGTIFVVHWLALLPLFWLSPTPREPKGYDGCTYWEDCVEKLERFRELSSPDQKNDKDRSTPE